MNSLRITSGEFKGRKIATPGGATHPMGERERLALFNMITGYVAGARVLDAFAGSGALGIEALSRGASEVIFIEKNPRACEIIRKNLEDVGQTAEIFSGKVGDFVTKSEFGMILADPPYDDFKVTEVEHLVEFLGLGGVLALSHPGEAPELTGLTLTKSKNYAGATISVYTRDTD